MRTKKALINYLVDAVPQVIILLINFIKVKLLLQYVGEENLGIFQLFGQLVTYLSLADFGITGAMMAYLYSPIANNNHKKIGELFQGIKKVFNYISIFVFVGGIILSFFVMFFIKETSVSAINIQMLFCLFVLSNVLGYFLIPYNIIFDSNQKRYIYNIYYQIIAIVKTLVEIYLVITFKNLLSLIILMICTTLIQNIIIRLLYKKNFPYIKDSGKKDTSFLKEGKSLVFHKIGSIIAYNIDIVIISKIIGLVEVAKYTLFVSITEALKVLIEKIIMAVMPGIGNLIALEKHKAYQIFLEFNALLFYIAIVVCGPLMISINNFIGIWYGKNYMGDIYLVIVLVMLLFYNIIRIALSTFTTAGGLFKQTVICVFLECVINLSLSLALVTPLGMKGVLLATLVAYIISEYLIKPSILNRHLFNNKLSTYYLDNFKYLLIFIVLTFSLNYIYQLFDIHNLLLWLIYSLLIFIINLVLTTIIFNLINKLTFKDRLITIFKDIKSKKEKVVD